MTWPDAREGDAADVYARAVAGGSGTLGDEFLVYAGEEYQYTPAVAANEVEGDYLVVWQETDAGDIYGQRTLTESTAGETFTITVADGNQESPAVAWDVAQDQYLVVWAHDNGSDADVRGRVVPAAGDPVAAEITITAAAADEQYPAVAANGAGGYVVAWQPSVPMRVRQLSWGNWCIMQPVEEERTMSTDETSMTLAAGTTLAEGTTAQTGVSTFTFHDENNGVQIAGIVLRH